MKMRKVQFLATAINTLFSGRQVVVVDCRQNHDWEPDTEIVTDLNAVVYECHGDDEGDFHVNSSYGIFCGIRQTTAKLDRRERSITLYSPKGSGGMRQYRVFRDLTPAKETTAGQWQAWADTEEAFYRLAD